MSEPIKKFLDFADNYLNFEKTPKKNIFWLETMKFLCKELGNPEKSCPAFHVAGSKGKGSISIMIASILEAAGKTTGVYSSPHILKFSERIGTVKGPLNPEIYEKSANQIIDKINSLKTSDFPEERPLTWFELVTAFGMVCFKNMGTDCTVYEVGLGGRLDATNVISPAVCCISTIELEHTEFLGDTLEKIAAEKAGIIKPGVPVVICPQKPEVRAVFEEIAAERNAPIIFTENTSNISKVVYKNIQTEQNNIQLNNNSNNSVGMEVKFTLSMLSRPVHTILKMPGEFQAQNAIVAAAAVKTAFPEITEEQIEKGLSQAFLPGRFEIIPSPEGFAGIPNLILDGAHTVNSIRTTLNTFQKLYGSNSNCHLIFGCAADKDVTHIAQLFKDKFKSVTITRPGDVKASDIEKMHEAFKETGIPCSVNENYVGAIFSALSKASEEKASVLVTGSFYLVSEVKKAIS